MVSLFLEEIETYLALEPAGRAKPTPLFFIFHLLGEWREKAAYRALARLLRLPRRDVDAIFGDGITTTSHRVMASVFDGDPQPLYDIILDPNAEQFIRAGMCQALAMVTVRGELDRAVTDRFLRDAFIEMRPQAECYVWVGWQSAIAMLGMTDLKLLVRKAFDRAFIDSHVLGFDHFEEDLRRGIEHPGEPRLPDDRDCTLFGDTVEELSGWYCFTEQYRDDQERWRRQAEANHARSQRLENPFKGIVDPCERQFEVVLLIATPVHAGERARDDVGLNEPGSLARRPLTVVIDQLDPHAYYRWPFIWSLLHCSKYGTQDR